MKECVVVWEINKINNKTKGKKNGDKFPQFSQENAKEKKTKI